MTGNNRLRANRSHSAPPAQRAQPEPLKERLGSLNSIMMLQRTVGNQAVTRLLKDTGSSPSLIQRNESLRSIGAISLDLAGGDIGRADILRKMIATYSLPKVREAVTEVPYAFTSEERAEMTMQFLQQPGAGLELVSLAVNHAGAQDDKYLGLLKLMLNAQEAAGGAILSAAHLDVVVSCADEIGGNKSHLQYVVAQVANSNDLAATRKKLDQVKKFNFNEKLEQRVDAEAAKHAGFALQDKLHDIDKLEAEQKKSALDGVKDQASQATAVRKAKTAGLREQELLKEQSRLAKNSLDTIGSEAEEQRNEAKGPWRQEVHDKRKGQYADYYRAVHFHPQAEKVLKLASNSFSIAIKLMDIVMLGKDGESLVFQSNMSLERLVDLRDTFAVPQIGQLLNKLQAAGLASYMQHPSYIAFLHRLFLAPIPDARLQELAKQIGKFHAYCADQPAVGHFITLVQGGYTIGDIVKLLDKAPPYKTSHVNKMGLLATLSVKAATANDLLAALTLCEQANWSEGRILAEQTAWPNGANAAALELAIQSNMMQNVDKTTQFTEWMRLLVILVGKNYHTIAYSNVQRLRIAMPTNELVCTVTGNGMNETFVVHGHPGAGNADVNAPNASKIHLKPASGAGVNERLKEIPDLIKKGIGEARMKELVRKQSG